MNKNLRVVCAALAIALLPVSATCLAKTNVEERYETIWVEAENTKNETDKKSEVSEYSIDDVVRFKADKSKTDAYMGKDIIIKMKVCKIKESGDNAYIMSKDSSMKKAKCSVDKNEIKKCKEGDEVVVKGILKEIKGNKIIIENAKIMKVTDVNSKEYNKDKYKEKNNETKKIDDKKDCKDKKEENKNNCEEKKKEHKNSCEEKKKDKKEQHKNSCDDKKEDKKQTNDKKEINDNTKANDDTENSN